MKNERSQLKSELVRTSIKENYIEYVKIERKIIKLEKDIQVHKYIHSRMNRSIPNEFRLISGRK
jgi:hypothetical protein